MSSHEVEMSTTHREAEEQAPVTARAQTLCASPAVESWAIHLSIIPQGDKPAQDYSQARGQKSLRCPHLFDPVIKLQQPFKLHKAALRNSLSSPIPADLLTSHGGPGDTGVGVLETPLYRAEKNKTKQNNSQGHSWSGGSRLTPACPRPRFGNHLPRSSSWLGPSLAALPTAEERGRQSI